jgi:hypothetical protein
MHPDIVFELAKLRIAESLREAEAERRVREAGRPKPVTIDAASYRQRVLRLFGAGTATSPAGA